MWGKGGSSLAERTADVGLVTQGKVRGQRPPAHPTQSFSTTLCTCREAGAGRKADPDHGTHSNEAQVPQAFHRPDAISSSYTTLS